MHDLVFVILTIAFFALTALIVKGVERRAAVSLENAIGLIVAICFLGYLGVALLFPERF